MMTNTAGTVTDGISRDIVFPAPISKVFEALTMLDGIRGWWAANTSGSAEPGKTFDLHFAGGHEATMRVDNIVPTSEVAWTAVSHEPFAEWAGTQITFRLSEAGDGGTRVSFLHEGLASLCACYDVCEQGWDFLLSSSLRAFVTAGKDSPA